MMHRGFPFGLFLLLTAFTSFAQQTEIKISGVVIDAQSKISLPGASVYLDQTTKGTTTNEKGEFVLKVPSGNYNLIVSYVGYKPLSIPMNALSNPVLHLELEPSGKSLDEVNITADSNWQEYFMLFRMFFFGRTGTQSTIVNPKVLSFNYSKSYVLTAQAGSTLIIENQLFGYKVFYDLTFFSHVAGRTSYTGYTHFEEIVPKDMKEQERWMANRENAYYGSSAHFMRALANRQLKEEGFLVKILEKTKTPPASHPVLKRWQGDEHKAPDTIVTMRWNGMDYSPQDTIVLTNAEKSKADKWGSKAGFNVLYPGEVPYKYIVQRSPFEGNSTLSFPRSLFITYKKKKSQTDFWGYGAGYRPSFPTSIITMLKTQTLIDNNGNLSDPNAIINEGYWAAFRVANQLPVDFVPVKAMK
ncbi:MAG: carboxypeptidase-like regulatory domain-containing protein [Bacteroidota bacterium]